MAAISGTGARIRFSTSTGTGGVLVDDMTQWNLTINGGLIDTNAFGSTWRTAIAGLRGGQGSGQGFWNATTAGSTEQRGLQTHILGGAKGHVQLLVDNANGNGYEGDAWISNLQIGAQVEGAISFQYDFTFDGAVTFSTSL